MSKSWYTQIRSFGRSSDQESVLKRVKMSTLLSESGYDHHQHLSKDPEDLQEAKWECLGLVMICAVNKSQNIAMAGLAHEDTYVPDPPRLGGPLAIGMSLSKFGSPSGTLSSSSTCSASC